MESDSPGLTSQVFHLLPKWHFPGNLIFQGFSFLIGKMGEKLVFALQNLWEDEIKDYECKALRTGPGLINVADMNEEGDNI